MSRCRECQRKKVQEYRKDPINEYNKKSKLRNLSAKKAAIEYKGGACEDCRGIFPESVYDFHHTDPTKKDISPADALKRTFAKAKEELDKCILLCANCHRIRHWENYTENSI